MLSIISLIISFAIFASPQNVNAIICSGSVDGDWEDVFDGCLSPSTRILSSDEVFIDAGITITIPSGTRVLNFGKIFNEGTIINNGEIDNRGNIENNGIITNSGLFSNNTNQDITNNGSIINAVGGEIRVFANNDFINLGTLENNGTIEISGVEILNNGDDSASSGASIINNGQFTAGQFTKINNFETFINNGSFSLELDSIFINDGNLTNSGTIDTEGTISNYGTINNNSGGIINNFSFSTIFLGPVGMDNGFGGLINNFGNIEIAALLQNSGTIENDCSGVILGSITGNQPVNVCDFDQDGFTSDVDCDDNDDTVFPGTPCSDNLICTTNEICNNSGQCVGDALVCDDPPTPCFSGSCSEVFPGCLYFSLPPGIAPEGCNGFVCGIAGQCLTTCTDDSSCASDHYCSSGDCIPDEPLGSPCTDDAQCQSGFCVQVDESNSVCAPSNCVDGLPCTSDLAESGTGACLNDPLPAGTEVGGCNGFVCGEGGACLPACTGNIDCVSGNACFAGVCLPECTEDVDCASGDACFLGGCLPACTVDLDCASVDACFEGVCLPACTDNTDCATVSACFEGVCLLACTDNTDCATVSACSVEGVCLEDPDGDGVPDSEDTCPTTAGIHNGCPFGDKNNVVLHTVNLGQGKGSEKAAIEDAEVKVFDRNDPDFQTAYGGKNPIGTEYGDVFENNIGLVGGCTTDTNGMCTVGEETTGDYLVIVKYVDDTTQDPNGDIQSDKTVYTGLPKSPSDFDGTGLATKDFQFIKVFKKNGDIQFGGGKKTVVTGSILEVVYPMTALWEPDVTDYIYTYIFTSDSEWTTDMCMYVPEGYQVVGIYDELGDLVTTDSCTQTFIAGETKVTAFEVLDVGSPKKFDVELELDAKPKDKKSKKIKLTTASKILEKQQKEYEKQEKKNEK